MILPFEETLCWLDELGTAKHAESWPALLRERQVSLENEYKKLSVDGRDPIDYSDIATQAVYVFKYAMPRAYFADEFLRRHREKIGAPLFKRDHINVVSFGGGPASELVGLINFLEEHSDEEVASISYAVLDKNGEWEQVALKVISEIDTPIGIEFEFRELDFADSAGCKKIGVHDTDLLMFSYVSSELCALDQRDLIQQNLNEILSTMATQTRMLFIESKFTKFVKYFKRTKGFFGRKMNDDDGRIEVVFPAPTPTFQRFMGMTDSEPRSSSDSILSHWYVKH